MLVEKACSVFSEREEANDKYNTWHGEAPEGWNLLPFVPLTGDKAVQSHGDSRHR